MTSGHTSAAPPVSTPATTRPSTPPARAARIAIRSDGVRSPGGSSGGEYAGRAATVRSTTSAPWLSAAARHAVSVPSVACTTSSRPPAPARAVGLLDDAGLDDDRPGDGGPPQQVVRLVRGQRLHAAGGDQVHLGAGPRSGDSGAGRTRDHGVLRLARPGRPHDHDQRRALAVLPVDDHRLPAACRRAPVHGRAVARRPGAQGVHVRARPRDGHRAVVAVAGEHRRLRRHRVDARGDDALPGVRQHRGAAYQGERGDRLVLRREPVVQPTGLRVQLDLEHLGAPRGHRVDDGVGGHEVTAAGAVSRSPEEYAVRWCRGTRCGPERITSCARVGRPTVSTARHHEPHVDLRQPRDEHPADGRARRRRAARAGTSTRRRAPDRARSARSRCSPPTSRGWSAGARRTACRAPAAPRRAGRRPAPGEGAETVDPLVRRGHGGLRSRAARGCARRCRRGRLPHLHRRRRCGARG